LWSLMTTPPPTGYAELQTTPAVVRSYVTVAHLQLLDHSSPSTRHEFSPCLGYQLSASLPAVTLKHKTKTLKALGRGPRGRGRSRPGSLNMIWPEACN
jgi:hypothetical protein